MKKWIITLKLFLLLLIMSTNCLSQINNFRIGMWGGMDRRSQNSNNPYDIYTSEYLPAVSCNGCYSSTMGVLKEDGFDVVVTYQPDFWITKSQYLSSAQLAHNSDIKVIDGLMGFYKPVNDNNAWSMNGTNQYNINSLDQNARYNFMDLFDDVYSHPSVQGTFLGHMLGSENYAFHMLPYLNTYPACWIDCAMWDNNWNSCMQTTCGSGIASDYWKNAQVPPQNYSDATGMFKWKAWNLGLPDQIIVGEAAHSGFIPGFNMNMAFQGFPNWPADAHEMSGCVSNHCFYNPEDYLNMPNVTNPQMGDFFLEESYFTVPSRTWQDLTKNDPYGYYLGKYVSLDFARSKGYKLYSGIGVEQHDNVIDLCGRRQIESNFHSNPLVPNGNYLWFQTYNSIIHHAAGVFFWELGSLFKSSVPADVTNQQVWNNFNYPVTYQNDTYNRNKFPIYYQWYISNLAKELGYLKQENLLSDDDRSIIYTKTELPDEMCILPPSINYLPNTILEADIRDFYADNNCNPPGNTLSGDYSPNLHRGEEYGLRYTLRTNGTDVIMIISNPNPYSVHLIGSNDYLDFSQVANPVMRTVPTVDLLFEDNSITDVNDFFYKVEDASHTGREDVIGTGIGNFVVIKSVTLPLNNHTLQLDFGPFDTHILKFSAANMPDQPKKNCWQKIWTNQGNGGIGGWWMLPSDKYIAGNFIDNNGDGVEEILCVQNGSTNSWSNIVNWNATTQQWDWRWSNNGNNWINSLNQGWGISKDDRFFAFDYDGDGIDELLCIQTAAQAYAAIYKFDKPSNNWQWIWDNHGSNWFNCIPKIWRISPDDIFKVGDFNGDHRDKLLCIENPNTHANPKCKIIYYKSSCAWTELWFNANFTGLGFIGPWPISYNDTYVVGDYDGDGKSELLCSQDYFNVGLDAEVLNFDNLQNNCTVQYYNGGTGDISGWGNPIWPDDKIISGQLDNEPFDELMFIQRNGGVWATTEDYKTVGNFQWNWSNQNPPFNGGPDFPSSFINDWNVSDHQRNNTDYFFVQCLPFPDHKFLFALGSYGCDRYIASMYENDLTFCNGINNPDYKISKDLNPNQDIFGINLIPNPANGDFRISFSLKNMESAKIELLNLVGKTVLEKTYSDLMKGNHSFMFSTNELSNGIYLVKVSSDNLSAFKQLTVVK